MGSVSAINLRFVLFSVLFFCYSPWYIFGWSGPSSPAKIVVSSVSSSLVSQCVHFISLPFCRSSNRPPQKKDFSLMNALNPLPQYVELYNLVIFLYRLGKFHFKVLRKFFSFKTFLVLNFSMKIVWARFVAAVDYQFVQFLDLLGNFCSFFFYVWYISSSNYRHTTCFSHSKCICFARLGGTNDL